MDTSTHIVMGVGLAGLATLDPNVAGSPYMQTAVLATTLVASNAPDFDTVLKLRNNAVTSGTTEELLTPFQLFYYGHLLFPAY